MTKVQIKSYFTTDKLWHVYAALTQMYIIIHDIMLFFQDAVYIVLLQVLLIHTVVQYLWSNVVWSATECIRCSSRQHAFFAHTKISQLAVTISIQQNVVQFQITATVHDNQPALIT